MKGRDIMSYDGSLKFDTKIDESGFNAGIKKVGGIAAKGLATLGAAVAGTGAAFAAVNKSALDSVASLEQNVGGVETLFKDSAESVIANANRAYKTAQLSANQYMSTVTSFSASLLQGLGGDTAKAAEIADLAIIDMADNANKMGTAMEDIQNAYQGFAKQNYTMLDNLKLGYGGTQSEMVRLINDSGILEKEIKNLDNVTFDQMIMAIHKVQENLGITGTSALEASTTIEGSINSAKAAWDNFLNGSGDVEAFAESLTVAMEVVFKNLGEIAPRLMMTLPAAAKAAAIGVADAFKNQGLADIGLRLVKDITVGIIEQTPNVIDAAIGICKGVIGEFKSAGPELLTAGKNLLGYLVPLLIEGASQLAELGKNLLTSLVGGFVDYIPTALPKALEFMQGLGESIAEKAPELIQWGYELLSKLVEGITTAIPILIEKGPQVISTFANIINDNFPTILAKGAALLLQLVKGILSAIPTLIANIPQIITAIVDVIMAFQWLNLGKNIITFFKDGIVSMVTAVKTSATKIHSSVVSAIQNLPATLQSLGVNSVRSLGNGIRGLASYARSAAASVVSVIEAAILQLPAKMLSIGKNIVTGLWNGISGMTGWITSKVTGFANSILGGIKKALGIHSPSTVFRDQVGKYMALGMGVGFEQNVPTEDMNDAITESVDKMRKASYSVTANVPATTTSVITAEHAQRDDGHSDDKPEPREIVIHTHVDLDGKEVGNSVTRYVDQNMSDDEDLRRRGN